MSHTCANPWCHQPFEVTDQDLAFYEKVSPVFKGKKELIPPPTLCPDCRWQRRLAWRNERNLYHRKSDATGKQLIAMYAPETTVPVYERDVWIGNGWDCRTYARSFDEGSFIESYAQLLHVVPRVNLYVEDCENCDFTNIVLHNKNCYLIFGSGFSEGCYYSNQAFYCTDCTDLSYCEHCTLCSQLVDCENCYACHWSLRAQKCRESQFLIDCRNCEHCLGCWNLHDKQFCINNTQYKPEAYQQLSKEFLHSAYVHPVHALRTISQSSVHRASVMIGSEYCTGNFVYHSKNAHDCFNVDQCEDVRYLIACLGQKDSYDALGTSFGTHAYECLNTDNATNPLFCTNSTVVDHCLYTDSCHHCSSLFGCVGLKNAHYCILNKQYTEDEYNRTVLAIIHKMRERGEWGEFPPIDRSLYGYNETVAQEYFPLAKEEVLERGWRWRDENRTNDQYLGPLSVIPDAIDDVPNDIIKQILRCEATGKPYKIIPQELALYRKTGLPIPRKCPNQRHEERIALRNPRKLWKRTCAKCGAAMETSYAPNRPEIVYCERCYLTTVY